MPSHILEKIKKEKPHVVFDNNNKVKLHVWVFKSVDNNNERNKNHIVFFFSKENILV